MGNGMQLPAHVTSHDLEQVWDRYDKHKRGELSYNKAHKFLKDLAHVAGLKYDKSEADRLLKAVDSTTRPSPTTTAAAAAADGVDDPNGLLKNGDATSSAIPRIDFERFRRLFLVVLEKEREQQHQLLLNGDNNKKNNKNHRNHKGGVPPRQLSSSLKEVQTRMHQQRQQQQQQQSDAATADMSTVMMTVTTNDQLVVVETETKTKWNEDGRKKWRTIGDEADGEGEEDEHRDDHRPLSSSSSSSSSSLADEKHEWKDGGGAIGRSVDKNTVEYRPKAATIGVAMGASISEAVKRERRRREFLLGTQRRAAPMADADGGESTTNRYRSWDHLSTTTTATVVETSDRVKQVSSLATVSTRIEFEGRKKRRSLVLGDDDGGGEEESVDNHAKKRETGMSKERSEESESENEGEEVKEEKSEDEETNGAEKEKDSQRETRRDEQRKEEDTQEKNESERRKSEDKAQQAIAKPRSTTGLAEPAASLEASSTLLRRKTTSFLHKKATTATSPTVLEPHEPTVDVGEEDSLVSASLVAIHLASPLYHRHFVAWAASLVVLVAWLLLARLIRRLYLCRAIQQKALDEARHQRRLTRTSSSSLSPSTSASDLTSIECRHSTPRLSTFQRALLAVHRAVVGPLVSPRVGVFAFGAVCFGLATHGSAHDPSLTALFGLTLPSVVLGCCRWKHAVPLADPFNLLSFADGAIVFGIITGSLIAVSGVVGYLVVCTSLAISIPLATWHTRRWLHGLKPTGVSFVRDFLMAVVIYPLVGATVFVACMAAAFFVSGLLLSLIFGQIFIGDWSVTLRTVFQFILLTGLVLAIMIGKWPHALMRGGGSVSDGLSRPLVVTVSVLCLLCTAMTALTIIRSTNIPRL